VQPLGRLDLDGIAAEVAEALGSGRYILPRSRK
jgi:hypothetical protein